MNKKRFFDRLRNGLLGPTLDPDEVEGCERILDAMEGKFLSWIAYALATAFHETNHSMMPVCEANWLPPEKRERYFFRMYDIQGSRPKVARELGNLIPGDGILFSGRGPSQLTGRRNYQRASDALGIDLIGCPELALHPEHAFRILCMGMEFGWFTGKRLSDYLHKNAEAKPSFVMARYIVNGQDKANLIAGYATQFQTALLHAV